MMPAKPNSVRNHFSESAAMSLVIASLIVSGLLTALPPVQHS